MWGTSPPSLVIPGYSLVRRDQYFIVSEFGGVQELTVLLAFQARPLSGMNIVAQDIVPEIDWKALIQQDFHAILVSSNSFASSSAPIAISRETVGNCRRNSPREWPPSR